MNDNNQSLVKHLVESEDLRQWARKTVKAKGGSKEEAMNALLRAACILWERLDQGMAIQEPEAYFRTVMIKNWKTYAASEQQQPISTPAREMANALSNGAATYEADTANIMLQQTQLHTEKVERITAWNEVIMRREQLRRKVIIGACIAAVLVLLGAGYWFYMVTAV